MLEIIFIVIMSVLITAAVMCHAFIGNEPY